MKKTNFKAIAAASVATVALSCFMTSCEGRKMSNMEPTGETVEVKVESVDSTSRPMLEVQDDFDERDFHR